MYEREHSNNILCIKNNDRDDNHELMHNPEDEQCIYPLDILNVETRLEERRWKVSE